MSIASDAIKDNKKVLFLAFGLLAVSAAGLFMTKTGISSPASDLLEPTIYGNAQQVLEEDTDYRAIIKTSLGNIEVDLYEEETPVTVNSFVFLAGKRFFDGLTFHRIVPGFVIQGGDPKGNGTGGPGYKFQDEITERNFSSYTLGMANSGANTNGSQFFITSSTISDENLAALNGKYTIFGVVTKGFAVVDSIEKVEIGQDEKPINPVTIESIQILEG